MGITFQQSGNQGNITLDGELTVNEAETLRGLLIKALIAAEEVNIDFGTITAIDLSCLQLLCSAHRSAVRMQKQLAFAGGRPDAFRQAMNEAGFKRTCGCRLDVGNTCLWKD